MRVELALGDLPQVIKIFQEFLQKKFPFKTMYKINKIAEALDAEGRTFDKVRREILIKYCEVDENGELKIDDKGQVKPKDGKMDVFVREMNEFLSEKTEINIKPLTVEEFEESDEKVSGQEMRVLMMFIENEPEEKQ